MRAHFVCVCVYAFICVRARSCEMSKLSSMFLCVTSYFCLYNSQRESLGKIALSKDAQCNRLGDQVVHFFLFLVQQRGIPLTFLLCELSYMRFCIPRSRNNSHKFRFIRFLFEFQLIFYCTRYAIFLSLYCPFYFYIFFLVFIFLFLLVPCRRLVFLLYLLFLVLLIFLHISLVIFCFFLFSHFFSLLSLFFLSLFSLLLKNFYFLPKIFIPLNSFKKYVLNTFKNKKKMTKTF